MKTYYGIDPGAAGAIAAIYPASNHAQVWPMPYSSSAYDLDRLRELLSFDPENEQPFAIIEKVHAMPKQGVTSVFSFGKGDGILLGMLGALKIPHIEVPPRTWQKVMLEGEDKTDGKAASIRVARRLFPGVSLRASDRCRVDHDGMAEALLMADYGRRIRA